MMLAYTVLTHVGDWCCVLQFALLVTHLVLCTYVIKVHFRPAYGTPDVHKRIVFITGCDSGFGHALAIRLDSLGVIVVAGCLQADEGRGTEALKRKCSSKLKTLQLDVTKQESVDKCLAWVKANIRQDEVFWCVVNNAGIDVPSELEFTPMSLIHRLMDVNCFGQLRVIQAFLPLLRASQGRVVNVASVVGKVAMYNLGGYCMSKFAVEAMSDVLRQEMVKWSVKVSIIEPGPYATGIGTDPASRELSYLDDIWNEMSEEVKVAYGRQYLDAYAHAPEFCTQSDISPVVDAMEDAVLSPDPLRRYTMGSGSFYMPFLNTVCQPLLDRNPWLMVRNTVYPQAVPDALKK